MILPILSTSHALLPVKSNAPHPTVAMISPGRNPAQLYYAFDRPWSEQNPAQRKTSWPPPLEDDPRKYLTTDDANRFRRMVDVSFLPGELHEIVAIPVSVPTGTRLFLQDASMTPTLPKGQRTIVAIGYLLQFDSGNHALIALYADHKTPIIVQVSRDKPEGAGKVTLIINGDYVDIPVRSGKNNP